MRAPSSRGRKDFSSSAPSRRPSAGTPRPRQVLSLGLADADDALTSRATSSPCPQDVVQFPANPTWLYAATYLRRSHHRPQPGTMSRPVAPLIPAEPPHHLLLVAALLACSVRRLTDRRGRRSLLDAPFPFADAQRSGQWVGQPLAPSQPAGCCAYRGRFRADLHGVALRPGSSASARSPPERGAVHPETRRLADHHADASVSSRSIRDSSRIPAAVPTTEPTSSEQWAPTTTGHTNRVGTSGADVD